jgi:hypothetical protein
MEMGMPWNVFTFGHDEQLALISFRQGMQSDAIFGKIIIHGFGIKVLFHFIVKKSPEKIRAYI